MHKIDYAARVKSIALTYILSFYRFVRSVSVYNFPAENSVNNWNRLLLTQYYHLQNKHLFALAFSLSKLVFHFLWNHLKRMWYVLDMTVLANHYAESEIILKHIISDERENPNWKLWKVINDHCALWMTLQCRRDNP